MTSGYPPPPREWWPSEPEEEPDTGGARRSYPGRGAAHQAPEPTRGWGTAPASSSSPGGSSRRIPQPPPPARHVPASGGLHAQPQSAPPYPQSPQAYGTPQTYGTPRTYGSPQTYPARPTSPPPSMRRPPPAAPRLPPPMPARPKPQQAAPLRTQSQQTTGALWTGGANTATGPRTGGFTAPGGAKGNPVAGAARTTNFMPPTVPNRKPGTRPPIRPALPTPRRPRTVSFKEVPGLIRQLPHHRPWMVAIGTIAVVVVLTVCGFGSWMLVKDDSQIVGAPPTPLSTVVKRDITNRTADPNPMTAADTFPNVDIVVDPAVPPYKRMGEAQVAEDCRAAATGEVGKLLASTGCNQVIRATFSTPDGAYFVTGGIFNLPDGATATQLATDVRVLIAANQGRFSAYISDPNANVILGRAPTNLAWEVRGHFIVYTVIAKVDGSVVEADDLNVKVIIYDILQKYLRDHVIDMWAIEKTPPSVSASHAT